MEKDINWLKTENQNQKGEIHLLKKQCENQKQEIYQLNNQKVIQEKEILQMKSSIEHLLDLQHESYSANRAKTNVSLEISSKRTVRAVANRDLTSVVDPKIAGYPCPSGRGSSPCRDKKDSAPLEPRPHSYPTIPHITIALLGRFKNEIGESYHLMPVVASTPRGLEPKKWVGRALDEWEKCGVLRGYLLCSTQGDRLPASYFEPRFLDRLEQVKFAYPELIPPHTNPSAEYGVSRSFRRGATSEVTNQGIPSEVIEANGRWRKSQTSGSQRAKVSIREHYTDIRLTLNLLLRFSQAL